MTGLRVYAALAAAAALAASPAAGQAQSAPSSVPKSMAPVTAPTNSNNGQSACVQYGDCTTGSNTFKTEKQMSPITSPPSTSVPDLPNGQASSSYMASIAAEGASQAYAKNSGSVSSTPVPPPTTVVLTSVMTKDGQVTTSTSFNAKNAAVLPYGAPYANLYGSLAAVALALVLALAVGASPL
ncbi:hypothetical protein MSPP1_002208 [Malassezia sp. CBS 17886]|nr:hypothetical protein MSPP1_002208 [Malassezia sp. CBS 17886]